MIDVEQLAIALYAKDGFLLAMYSDPAESWKVDREAVREKYRQRARAVIAAQAAEDQKDEPK